MKLSKIVAVMALAVMSVVPMTVSAATYDKAELKPAKIQVVKDKEKGLDMSYFQVKDLNNVTARHTINRAIINAVGDLILEHKSELEDGTCSLTITPEVRYNNAGILSATFTGEGYIKGAAHGFKAMKSINYNYITGQEITANDLNKLYAAAKMAPAYTTANLTNLLKKTATDGKLGLITGFNGLEKLPPFYLTGDSLDIYAFFQPYEVAPYAAGIVTLKVQ